MTSLSSYASRSFHAATPSNPIFLESTRPAIMSALDKYVIPDLATIIADYAIQGKAFMAEDWERYYNIEVEDLEIDPEFYKWWGQPDAGDPSKLNYETHFPPVLCPGIVLESVAPAFRHRFSSSLDRSEYNLEMLGRLVQNPKEGYPSQFAYNSLGLQQNRQNKAGDLAPSYIVARKELFARNLPADQQKNHMIKEVNAKTHAGYQVLPRALHLATVAFVHHTVTGKRFLGDASGMEGKESYGRCKDATIHGDNQHLIMVGGQRPFVPATIEDPDPVGGLYVQGDSNFVGPDIGVVGLREFSAYRRSMPA